MSTNQATLSIDKETKLLAEKRAKRESLPLSIVAKILLRDYATGNIHIGSKTNVVDENGFTKEEVEEILEAIKESKDPSKCSSSFSNAKDAIAWLKNNR